MSVQSAPDSVGRWLAIAASVVVAATLVAALWMLGSPLEQRQANIDGRRVDDLSDIAGLIDEHLLTHDALPEDLATLAEQPGRQLSIVDPVDGTPYDYEVTGARTYRLCAVFVTDTSEIEAAVTRWPTQEWTHGTGRHCFDRKAAPRQDE